MTDLLALAAELVDIPSESFHEKELADRLEADLRGCAWLEVHRIGDNLVARTEQGRPHRLALAGHTDTVPANDNASAVIDADVLRGLGACDMKGSLAAMLDVARTVSEPAVDVTYVFYECEEVEAERNGLFLLSQSHPDLLQADFAILMEPSDAVVEAGCQGTMRVDVLTRGERAHSARSWMGANAIHGAADVLARLNAYEPRRPVIDGLEYREGLNAVFISGGVAGNVLPDECRVSVNYRFAPDRSEEEAFAHMRDVFAGFEIEVSDSAPSAMPGLTVPAAAAFVEAVGGTANPKFGWTDVARFSVLGVPAVNFGPGDPHLAHKAEEFVPLAHIRSVEGQLRRWLGGDAA